MARKLPRRADSFKSLESEDAPPPPKLPHRHSDMNYDDEEEEEVQQEATVKAL
jgi:hypothetical protein